MKKLNKKGFTLIELLAVIVIMGIIVIITVPTILQTIDDAKVQSLWNLTTRVANDIDIMRAGELISSENSFGDIKLEKGGTGVCLYECVKKGTSGLTCDTKLYEVLGISDKDIKIGSKEHFDFPSGPGMDSSYSNGTVCSFIKLDDNGNAIVELVAARGGKYDIKGMSVHANSRDAQGFAEENVAYYK